jgi:hypothetical protein
MRATARKKPVNIPRVHHLEGAPIAWFLAQRPGRTFPGDSGDVPDIMRSSPAGVRNGGATWSTGREGAQIRFDGSTGYVLNSRIPTVAAPLTFTLRCTPAEPGGYQPIARIQNGSYYYAALAIYLWNTEVFAWYSTAAATITGVTRPVAGTEYHVACTYDGATAKLYVNGILEGSGAWSALPAITAPAGLTLGSVYGLGAQYFSGAIHDVRQYPRVLPAEEIAIEVADPYWRLRRSRRSIFALVADSHGVIPPAPDPRRSTWSSTGADPRRSTWSSTGADPLKSAWSAVRDN